ncbi:hypothetical protein QBC41DRAFT_347723 [Cercophora samala]|uniref:Extracellular membrane protein CFEM domain-containing protein n=1 Tax=Cercophora samala TaxID=330535 RepID=A0AA39ZBE4_9PEZI|nr:hypothetical protein QBC41DRAFT_347723 [Cercophora samala]
MKFAALSIISLFGMAIAAPAPHGATASSPLLSPRQDDVCTVLCSAGSGKLVCDCSAVKARSEEILKAKRQDSDPDCSQGQDDGLCVEIGIN